MYPRDLDIRRSRGRLHMERASSVVRGLERRGYGIPTSVRISLSKYRTQRLGEVYSANVEQVTIMQEYAWRCDDQWVFGHMPSAV
jgi:hypothetical protein